jgi:hypothetical protein
MKLTDNILFVDLDPLTGLQEWAVLQVTLDTKKFGVNHPESDIILRHIHGAARTAASRDKNLDEDLQKKGHLTLKDLFWWKDRCDALSVCLLESGIVQFTKLVSGTGAFHLKNFTFANQKDG